MKAFPKKLLEHCQRKLLEDALKGVLEYQQNELQKEHLEYFYKELMKDSPKEP